MNENSTSRIRGLAALLAALVAVSAVGGTVAAAAASSTVSLTNTQDLTDDTGQIDVGFVVNASTATTNVTLTSIEAPDGTSVNLSSTVSAGSSMAVRTDSGTNDQSTIYSNLSGKTELPVSGTLTLTYTQNGTSYSDTISYDVDSDGDGIPDASDPAPNTQPVTKTINASDNDSVSTAYVEVASDGTVEVDVFANGSEIGTKTTAVNLTDSEAATLVEVDVGDSHRDYSSYDITYHTGANVTDTGLTYVTTSGGGSTDGGSTTSPLNGYSDVQALGGIVALAAAIFLHARWD